MSFVSNEYPVRFKSFFVLSISLFSDTTPTIPPPTKPPLQVYKCTLPLAHNIHIGGNDYCHTYRGRQKFKDAAQLCNGMNSRLPLPRNQKDVASLQHAFGLVNLKTAVVIDATDFEQEGTV